jgi:hypothetical protein
MLAGFRRLSIGIMWYVEVMVRGSLFQRPMLRDVVVVGVGCVEIQVVSEAGYLSGVTSV